MDLSTGFEIGISQPTLGLTFLHITGGVKIKTFLTACSVLAAPVGTAAIISLAAASEMVGGTASALLNNHWVRDTLCSAVGLVGAAAWIGIWSRLARSDALVSVQSCIMTAVG